MDTSNLLIIHTNTVNTDFLFPDKRCNFTPNFSILPISPTNFLSSEESQHSNQSVLEFPYFFFWWKGEREEGAGGRGRGRGEGRYLLIGLNTSKAKMNSEISNRWSYLMNSISI